MSRSAAEIVREYGPFPGVDAVHGVSFDGRHVWFASGDRVNEPRACAWQTAPPARGEKPTSSPAAPHSTHVVTCGR